MSDKNKTLALILCIFLGYSGAHHFYVGRYKTGILYLFTVGLFWFGWAIDIFLIIRNYFRDSEGKVLSSEKAFRRSPVMRRTLELQKRRELEESAAANEEYQRILAECRAVDMELQKQIELVEKQRRIEALKNIENTTSEPTNIGNDIQTLTPDEKRLIEAYRGFNGEGKEKVLDTASDMLQLDRYKKSGDAEQTEPHSNGENEIIDEDEADEKLVEAIEFVVTSGYASAAFLQRRLKIGYGRAARLLDTMEKIGVVSAFEGRKPRQVLMTKQEWDEQKPKIESLIAEIRLRMEQQFNGSSDELDDGEADEKLEEAIEFVVTAGQASTSALQRRLKLGYGRAARLIDTMEKMGIVGAFEGSKPRQVLMTRQEWYERRLRNE